MNVKCLFAKSNQAVNNPGMEVAGCSFDLPTSCVMSPVRFRCGIMLRKLKFAKLCVFHCLVLFLLSSLDINSSKVLFLVSDLDIASVLELALRQARNCFLFIKILDCY